MMAYHVVTWKQILGYTLSVSIFTGLVVVMVITGINYLDLPEVHVNGSMQCVRVVNNRNGDAYQCPDKDVTLRVYRIVHVHG